MERLDTKKEEPSGWLPGSPFKLGGGFEKSTGNGTADSKI